jgi:hypothetical protein
MVCVFDHWLMRKMFWPKAVANPHPEVRFSGEIHNTTLCLSTGPDLRIGIRNWRNEEEVIKDGEKIV